MTDPTPTPDTLRDDNVRYIAEHYLRATAWVTHSPGPGQDHILRRRETAAALAASPAPTDSPDDLDAYLAEHMRDPEFADAYIEARDRPDPAVLPPNHGEWLPEAGTYEDGATEQQRRSEVRATTCRRLGHHWTPGGVCDRCGDTRQPAVTDSPDERCADCGHPHADHLQGGPHDYACWHGAERNGCGCEQYARPAAVTAPTEDERCGCGRRSDDASGSHAMPYLAACTGLNARLRDIQARHLAAAAPAVERATPDPDTLAALIGRSLGHPAVCAVAFGLGDPCDCGLPDRATRVARALIAAGVTLNETAGR